MNRNFRIFFFITVIGILFITSCKNSTSVYKQWHTVTLSFKGPETSETAKENPFLNYRLSVVFQNGETKYTIQGFYAADGNAAETGSKQGNIWQVRFTPDKLGKWSYSAQLSQGDSIALSDDLNAGKALPISNAAGDFQVVKTDKEGADFRAYGRIVASDGYYKFRDTEKYWLKAGTNSPENLLAYVDFDDTYRIKAEVRDGEAAAPTTIHTYEPHLKDWKTGDPTWKNGKGKSLIGAVNYLASKGMNAVYFLTLNILGDGKDVWPYVSPDDFTRFDVSKLDQWEIVFEYMQSKGILLHVVLQETENETMLDNGDTGSMRQLYFRELIARFGHHLGLVWNLGEENGPVPWAKDMPAQNDAQRKAMAKFIKKHDPYNHPVVLHTLPNEEIRKDILNNILGYEYLDGISLQHAERVTAPEAVFDLKAKSDSIGHPWLITMDEIGMWYDGAMTDAEDPNHPTLQRYALWGTLLSGGAGVEWYFGAKHPHNDLSSEDWRQRDRLWEITNYAKVFFDTYLPYWEMKPNPELINTPGAYCLSKTNEIYALYIPNYKSSKINLQKTTGEFQVYWYNPFTGGEFKTGAVASVMGGEEVDLGNPPSRIGEDWVILLSKNIYRRKK
ncbi:MAG: DUF5060 domain-containing protein [Salinivirgaceae bacterium]|nr:MAG: DUF5060 domain-containing protein [Salinivirgaceae bacterium]